MYNTFEATEKKNLIKFRKLVNQGETVGKDDLILPEEDGYLNTNPPHKKWTNKKKGNKTRHLTKCRRSGLVDYTVKIKTSNFR